MEGEEEEYPGLLNFQGLTTGSLSILNNRLTEVRQPKILNLKDLKDQVAKGLLRKSRKEIVGKGVGRLIDAATQNAMLKASGLSAGLSFTGAGKYKLDEVLEQAIQKTEKLLEQEVTPKVKAIAPKTKEIPVTVSACGETFDPERCSLSKQASSPYRLDQVEAFLKAYHIYKPTTSDPPKDSDYKSLCNLLTEHWTRYMTAALVDVFGSNKVVKLSSKDLRNMAIERGIKFESSTTDMEITKSLIRYMVDSILTIDAAQYGLGKSSGPLIDTLMGGDLKLENLEPKSRLAIIMVGSRFNKKLLDFVTQSIDSEVMDSLDFKKEFNDFQQGLANLRKSVESLKPEQSVRIASGLAQAIAKTTKMETQKTAEAVSHNTSAPLPTKKRVSQELLTFLADASFDEHPTDTFVLFSELLAKSKIIDTLARSTEGYVVFATTDAAIKDMLKRFFQTDFETFSTLKSVHNALRMMVLKKSKLESGKFKALDGSSIVVQMLEDKFNVIDTERKYTIVVSAEYNEHSEIRFHRTANMLLQRDLKAVKAELVNLSKAPSSPKKTSVKQILTSEEQAPSSPKKTSVKQILTSEEQPSSPKKTSVKQILTSEEQAPSSPKKTSVKQILTSEEQPSSPKKTSVKQILTSEEQPSSPKKTSEEQTTQTVRSPQKTPVELPDLIQKHISSPRAEKSQNVCQTVLESYKNKDLAKLSALIFGQKSVFGNFSNLNVKALRQSLAKITIEVKRSGMFKTDLTMEAVNFLIDLKESMLREREINGLFDVSINLKDIPNSCQVLRDLINGRKTATPQYVAPKSVTIEKKSALKSSKPSKVIPKVEEPISLENLDEIVEVSGVKTFDEFIGSYDTDGTIIINADHHVVLFAPSEEAFDKFFKDFDLDPEETLQNVELVEAIMKAHYTIDDENTDPEHLNDSGWTPQGVHYETDGIDLYVVDKVKLSEDVKNLLGDREDSPEKEELSTSETKSELEAQLSSREELSITYELIKLSNLGEQLFSQDFLTLFAPTNDAWNAILSKTKTKTAEELNGKFRKVVLDVLRFHVYEGTDLSGPTLKSLQGKMIPLTSNSFGSASIIEVVKAGNNTILITDEVQTKETIDKIAQPKKTIEEGKVKGTSEKTVRSEIAPKVKILEEKPKKTVIVADIQSDSNEDDASNIELDIE
jgi:hypothetical protein